MTVMPYPINPESTGVINVFPMYTFAKRLQLTVIYIMCSIWITRLCPRVVFDLLNSIFKICPGVTYHIVVIDYITFIKWITVMYYWSSKCNCKNSKWYPSGCFITDLNTTLDFEGFKISKISNKLSLSVLYKLSYTSTHLVSLRWYTHSQCSMVSFPIEKLYKILKSSKFSTVEYLKGVW